MNLLKDYQHDAVQNMKNGCILCGGVGSGKSRTSLAYYYQQNGGDYTRHPADPKFEMVPFPRDLYIITTARKRDLREWESELLPFGMSTSIKTRYDHKIVVDSWNNIKKYKDVVGAFFIFDEQRLVGSGVWVKTFLRLAVRNKWILLSATPGDTWSDYIPVFVANGFYRNKTEMLNEHAQYEPRVKFPKIARWVNTGKLLKFRNDILVDMEFSRQTCAHNEYIAVYYDYALYKDVGRRRWNPFTDEPIVNAAELCYVWRKITNMSEERQIKVLEICEKHPRLIIFYNFNYELDILRGLGYQEDVVVAEWNGHKHEALPCSDKWVYLVQYTAGCEGWNCIETNATLFFSQNYSYKVLTQAMGRIDRLNTPFKDLYYYHLVAKTGIDLGISQALRSKKQFNESRYIKF